MSNSGFFGPDSILPNIINPEVPVNNERALAELLRRCSVETLEAAIRYRATRAVREVPAIIRGVINRYLDSDKRDLLHESANLSLRLVEDLSIDSLSLIEISMTLEDVLEISLPDEKLRTMRTMGDVMNYAHSQITPDRGYFQNKGN